MRSSANSGSHPRDGGTAARLDGVRLAACHNNNQVLPTGVFKHTSPAVRARGKRTMLRFLSNEEARAMCEVCLEVGRTYVVETMMGTECLAMRTLGRMDIPSTHPKYGDYLRDLEEGEIRPMYVEANTITSDPPNRCIVLRGKVQLHYDNAILFADQVIDDSNANDLLPKVMCSW